MIKAQSRVERCMRIRNWSLEGRDVVWHFRLGEICVDPPE
jgi:hypothetical protein